MTLPTPTDYFPVRVPFKTAVDLYKMGLSRFNHLEDVTFNFDTEFERTITEKVAVFDAYPEHSMVFLDDDLNGLTETYWRALATVAAENPDYAAFDDNSYTSKLLGYTLTQDGALTYNSDGALFPELGRRCYDLMQKHAGAARTGLALALSVQADLAVMWNPSGEANADVAESLFVALPTHWNPSEMLGESLATIHEEVGDSERLVRASPRLIDAMIHKGPYFRYNWSLAHTDTLCLNPVVLKDRHSRSKPDLNAAPTPRAALDLLFFRVERQTFLSYADLNRSLFVIRIYARPLMDAIKTPERAEGLADALASMTPGHIEYRSMMDSRDQLIAGLREVAAQMN